jgi:HD superfamily phosphohydrolase
MQIFDPVHNFIPFTPIEEELLNHPFLVRLSHIYQCGPAFHVYPGVTHTRFSHTLGVMHVATMLFDTVASWVEDPFERQFLRQAVRLGALLHDVGHYPLSHTVELFLPKHEVQVLKTFDSKAFDPIFDKTAEEYRKKGADVKDRLSFTRRALFGVELRPYRPSPACPFRKNWKRGEADDCPLGAPLC